MAGYDVPHVTHDMILRFMGVNFTALTDGSVRIPSAVGSDSKPLPALLDEEPTPTPGPAKTPEQDKARWEGLYHNIYLYELQADGIQQHTTTRALLRSFCSS